MKIRVALPRVGLTALLLCALGMTPLRVRALAPPPIAVPTGLSFAEVKMTGSEYVVLQNNTPDTIVDLSHYALYYFNNYNPFAPGVSSSIKALPALPLDPGTSILLSGDPAPTCGADVAGDLGISLGDSSGFLQIVQLGASDNGAVAQTPGDVVSWSSGANGMIQNVPSNNKDGRAVWYRYATDAGYAWQYADIDSANPCQLNAVLSQPSSDTPQASVLLNSDDEDVPGVVLGVEAATASGPSIPAADMGLKAPKLSELLPDATGSDATDEFIELYNPNAVAFDLTGFVLQIGSTTSTTRHNYVFPVGTTITPRGFKALYSAETKLSLSNTGGQVWLLDPYQTPIAQSEIYTKPKTGNAWAVVGDTWSYTTSPTPGNSNKILQAAASSKKSSAVARTTKGTAITSMATKTSGVVAGASTAAPYDTAAKTAPLHPVTLAVVVGLALLYGAYEYRYDIANRYRQLREYRSARR